MFIVLVLAAVALVSLHIASYGLYALREEKNRRGAVGAFMVAGATFLGPALLLWAYAYFNF